MKRTRKDWTTAMALVALASAVVAAGAVWLMWTADPVLTLLAGTWAASTGLCVLASTRNLRVENEDLRKLLDAYNSSEARDDLSTVGPVSPARGTDAVYDQDAEREWVDIVSTMSDAELILRNLLDACERGRPLADIHDRLRVEVGWLDVGTAPPTRPHRPGRGPE